MQLKVLSYSDIEQVRTWRNDNMSMLRTPFPLTAQMQGEFFVNNVCNRQVNARYWGMFEHSHEEYPKSELTCDYDTLIGMGEISNIQWENRLGEIGLIMHPEHLGEAEKAIDLILEKGFDFLNLENIFGECYECSPYLSIWEEICGKYNARCCYLPSRKYWQGKYHNSLYFNVNRKDWKKCCN
ncbi:MAG: GNAT family protein [Candidatus Paceibacterota bacterium]|jgi:RimJ/RimL family protein N-acetyltransferase